MSTSMFTNMIRPVVRGASTSNTYFVVRTSSAAEARRTFSTPISSTSASSSAPSASSSRTPRRSARFAARPGADMVGPPDPISNLRPIRYGSAFEEGSSTSSSSASSDASSSAQASGSSETLSMSHPYSLHEFTTSGDSSFGWSGSSHTQRRGATSPSLYFERLLAKLEEAELAHKLRMARADSFNQRFWQDNNSRFIHALSEFRSRTGSSKAVATLPAAATSAKSNETAISSQQGQESELDLDSDSLATFYSAWLKANAARHRAYNRQLWKQTFGDLTPAARYQCLRAWAKIVGMVEQRLRRIR